MPKLVIKQNDGAASQQSSASTWLSVGGLLVLLIAVAAGAYFFTKTPLPGAKLEPLTFNSAADTSTTKNYHSMHAILGDLMAEYEGLAARGVDDYQKNLMLLGKAESILGHLGKMDSVATQLKLNQQEYSEVTEHHQFYKDFWQAKLHFRELRVSRFEKPGGAVKAVENAQSEQATVTEEVQAEAATEQQDATVSAEVEAVAEQQESAEEVLAEPETKSVQKATTEVENDQVEAVGTTSAESLDSTQPKKPKFQFAKPPEGLEMPAGFCDLSDPAASCKPGDEETMADGDALDLPLPPIDDLALPEDSLPLPEDSALPEDSLPLPDDLALPEDSLPLPEDLALPEEGQLAVDSDLAPASDDAAGVHQPKKPKFQFAKPPEGLEMPAGFCDLSDPAASCKPGDEETMAGGDVLDLPLPPIDDLALPEDVLPLPDNNLALPEELLPLPEDVLPLPADNVAAIEDSQPKKPKFQFAKPPEGLEMPAGFCDLSDPAASCKPGDAEAVDGDNTLGLALPPIDDLALPEGDLLSDVDQPVLNSDTDLDSNADDKSQL